MERYLFLVIVLLGSSLLAVPAPPPPSPNKSQAAPSRQIPPPNSAISAVTSFLSDIVIPQSRDPLQDMMRQLPVQSGIASVLSGHSRGHASVDNLTQDDPRETKRPRRAVHWDLSLDDNDEEPEDLPEFNIDELGDVAERLLNEPAHQDFYAELEVMARTMEARDHNAAHPDPLSRLPADLRRLILGHLSPFDRNAMRSACPRFKKYVDDTRINCHLTDTLPCTIVQDNAPDTAIFASSYPHIYLAQPLREAACNIWQLNIDNQELSFVCKVKDFATWRACGVVASDALYFNDFNSFKRLDLKTKQLRQLGTFKDTNKDVQIRLIGDVVVFISLEDALLFNVATGETRELPGLKKLRTILQIDGKPVLVVDDRFLIFREGINGAPQEVLLPESALDAVRCGSHFWLLTQKGVVLVSKDGAKKSSFAKVKCPMSGRLIGGTARRCIFKVSRSPTSFEHIIDCKRVPLIIQSYEQKGFDYGHWLLLNDRYRVGATWYENPQLCVTDIESGKSVKLHNGFRLDSRPIRVGPYIAAVCARTGPPFGLVILKIDIRGYYSEEDPSVFK